MITLQHTAIFMMVAAEKKEVNVKESLPWLLLPDAIRMYVGPRQASHFEFSPDETDVSWMEFPSREILKEISKENVADLIKFYVSPKAPKCVIGEQTNLDEFDIRNYAHPHYHELRTHLVQDCILDKVLREKLVDVTNRFEDRFIVRHNRSIELDGSELRKQITLFEQIGFMHLVGMVYKKTGILLNQRWFDENVHTALLEAYPEELAENTYKYMQIPEEIEQRISELDFELTEEDISKVVMTDELQRILDEMYATAYFYTVREF